MKMHQSGDGVTYYYIRTMFYSSKSTTSNRAQIAYAYQKNKIAYRYYKNGNWSNWFKQEITKYLSTDVKSNTTNSWQNMLNSAMSVTTKAGKYLCVLSFATGGSGNGMATVRPVVDSNEVSTAHRCSVPIGNGLVSSGQVVFYKDFTEGTHSIMPQIYANIANTTSVVYLELYRIWEV